MAVPSPERELTRLDKLVRDGEVRVLVLSGASRYFRGEAVERCVAAVPVGAELRRVDGQETTEGDELDDLRGAGLFGSGNWLCVRRGDAWLKTHGAVLAEILPRLGAGCGLILEVTRLDGRTKISKLLAEHGELFEFRELYTEPYDRSRGPLEGELCKWIQGRGRALGVRLTDEAAFVVQSSIGQDPAELMAELGRLAASFGGSSKAVDATALRGHLSCSFESSPFEFAEALLAADRRRVMRSVDAMFARGVRSRDGGTMDAGGVFPFVVSWTWQSLSTALRARALVDEGSRPGDAAAKVGVRHFLERFVEQIERNPVARLQRGLLLLSEAQRELRSTAESPQWIIERFVARYFQAIAASRRPAS